jgi:hypothetical protein
LTGVIVVVVDDDSDGMVVLIAAQSACLRLRRCGDKVWQLQQPLVRGEYKNAEERTTLGKETATAVVGTGPTTGTLQQNPLYAAAVVVAKTTNTATTSQKAP